MRGPHRFGIGLAFSAVLLCSTTLYAQINATESFLRDNERATTRRTPSAMRGLAPALFDPEAIKQGLVDLRLITPPLEKPIDPRAYRIGPGDHVLVTFSATSTGYALTITPEGLLVIPTVGEIDVRGLTLDEVKQNVENRARPRYRTGEISTILLYPRQFRITVSGSVNSPGQMIATPVDRLSEVLFMASRPSEIQNRSAAADPQYLMPSAMASDRNIEIRRQDGSRLRVDLRRYLMTGMLEHNPYLMDGDVIYVPTRKTEGNAVTISGAVIAAGLYEYAEGDFLGLLLDLAGGLAVSADRTRVEISRIHRNEDGSTRLETMPVDLTRNAEALDTPMLPGDRIFIRTETRRETRLSVSIRGEIRYPGVYPVDPEGVLLSRLIDLAGGFTGEAFLPGARALRPVDPSIPLTDAEQERVARLRMSRLGAQEVADFEGQALYRQQTLVADFVRIFERNDLAADLLLRPGDMVVIPSKNATIRVMGQVARPGQIPFEQNRDIGFYIAEAGGMGKHARRSHIQIIKAETGEWLTPEQTTLEVGDTIWIPRKPQRDYFAIFKETLSVAATLTTLYLVLQQIAN